jgi:hypothetical protein
MRFFPSGMGSWFVVEIDLEPEVLTHVHMILKEYYLLRAYPRLPSRGK